MLTKTKARGVTLFLFIGILTIPALAGVKKKLPGQEETTGAKAAVLWREPADIESRDLFYGPGGKEHEPHGTFKFVKEDMEGSNPKFVIEDQDGMNWKVKLGAEARPETVASRLLWAAGYFANEDYFMPVLQVENMPRLKRGQHFVHSDGSLHNVRLKREPKDTKKIGIWAWREDRFTDTRELNGLRAMMALMNNWDLKDSNNSIYEQPGPEGKERVYMVSDLGATFGTAGPSWPQSVSKGNFESYVHADFIENVKSSEVDFRNPSPPMFLSFLVRPNEFSERRAIAHLGKSIPRADARWIGQILSRLSPKQVRDAFRAAGYSDEDVEKFSNVLLARIAELSEL